MIERIVLFGASGDLTGRLLMPAVAQLAEANLLPQGLTIVGSANTGWSTEDFREHIASQLEKHAPVAPAARDAVVRMLSFKPADVTEAADVGAVIGDGGPATLVYLALPPGLLPQALTALASSKLGTSDAVGIEKPYGTDLASAQHLNEILRIQLPQPTIFRIDHFLSSELIRRIITLRFLNRVFEPTLNSVHVERVDISWLEDLTLEGRATYCDGTGAMKDMVQNHRWPGAEPNVLRLGLTEPYVVLGTTLNGSERTADIQQLGARSTPPRFTAYAHLILEMLKNDPMLFIRGDEAEEAWRIVDPVMSAWSAGDVPMQEDPAGGMGPPPVLGPRFRTGGGIRAREYAP